MKAKIIDITNNKFFIWIALLTGLILLVPLIAMQLTNEVEWTFSDFAIAGSLLFGAGAIFVILARRTHKNRLVISLILSALLLWIWAELAVGIFTNLGS